MQILSHYVVHLKLGKGYISIIPQSLKNFKRHMRSSCQNYSKPMHWLQPNPRMFIQQAYDSGGCFLSLPDSAPALLWVIQRMVSGFASFGSTWLYWWVYWGRSRWEPKGPWERERVGGGGNESIGSLSQGWGRGEERSRDPEKSNLPTGTHTQASVVRRGWTRDRNSSPTRATSGHVAWERLFSHIVPGSSPTTLGD